ncbi:hypothetical protein HZH68_010255 [Vespula germanica]|uniref:Uncharacterized protein n=1 Tax=Vespula germanica TaxID=30212 RepID=A0A834JXI6_VESGE|nr:hypothetical protein HZH68_010255 [Vespula germanica]
MRWRWRLETRTPRQPSTPALPQILDFTRSVLGFSRGCQAKEVEERGGRGVGGREVMEEMGRKSLNRPQIAFGICRTINLSNLRVIMWGVVECQMNDSMISRHG